MYNVGKKKKNKMKHKKPAQNVRISEIFKLEVVG